MAEATLESTSRKTYSYSYGPVQAEIGIMARTISEARKSVAPFRFQLAAREISKELQLRSGLKVLELGNGLGLLGEAIRKKINGTIDYFGIELAYQSAKDSEEKGLLETQADVTQLPFADNSFDTIVSTDLLEHVPDAKKSVEEIVRVLKPGGKAFIVIADPSEARFSSVEDHIDRLNKNSDVRYWEDLFEEKGLKVLSKESEKFRRRDWRKIFNLPFLVKFKDKPGFACAFNPINRPGTYILQKPENPYFVKD